MTWKPVSTPWEVSSRSWRYGPTKAVSSLWKFSSWGGGGYGWFQQKKETQTDFVGEKTLPKKYLGKNSGTEKKIYLMVYNADKNILHNYMSGEKFYLHRFVGKKSLTQTKSNPLQPTKSNGRRLRSANTSRSSGKRSPQLESENGRNQGWDKLSLMSLINGWNIHSFPHIFTGKCLA